MKKIAGMTMMAVMFAGTAMADTLEVRVLVDGAASVSVSPGTSVTVTIEGQLTGAGGVSDGLALWGANLTDTDGGSGVNLADQGVVLLTAPAGDMQQFDRNLGLTNPPGPTPGPSGYSGTDDAANGLLQLGGGQNTIGNTGPTLYPVGTVVTGVGNAGFTVLASGTLDTTGLTGTIVLATDTEFANTIDTGQIGPVYNVSAATVSNVGSGTIVLSAGVPDCDVHDVNCDGAINGLDIAVVALGTNFLQSCFTANDPRADVNRDGAVNGLDIAAISLGGVFLTAPVPLPCNCDTSFVGVPPCN